MANLQTIDPRRVKMGDIIKFGVKDYNDNVLYSGKVVAICDYDAARAYDDVVARHQSMLAADMSLANVERFTFLIVECYDGVRRPFGYCPEGPIQENGGYSWFTNDRVSLIDEGSEYAIKLFNCTVDEVALAIKILREQGFACKAVK